MTVQKDHLKYCTNCTQCFKSNILGQRQFETWNNMKSHKVNELVTKHHSELDVTGRGLAQSLNKHIHTNVLVLTSTFCYTCDFQGPLQTDLNLRQVP